MTPAVGSIVANRFELLRELGHGSMGTVWLADHLTLHVRCAVKFMTGEARRDPEYATRFELEARAVARVNSPNVVRVLDYDVHEGVPFIAMESLQGEDLGARIQRLGRLDAAATYKIVSEIAHGLAKAHAAGIVHRDLKPENVFLAQEDEGEIAKLLDFGVAKLRDFDTGEGVVSSTQAGTLLGTPAYMSPEQARGVGEIDHRADLWSLAVIAFECLTGRLPFDGAALGDLFAQILFEPLPVPSRIDPVCTPEFDRWWKRAVARDPHERFASAPELAEALGLVLGVVETPRSVPDTAATMVAAGCEVPPRSVRSPGKRVEAALRGAPGRPRAARGGALRAPRRSAVGGGPGPDDGRIRRPRAPPACSRCGRSPAAMSLLRAPYPRRAKARCRPARAQLRPMAHGPRAPQQPAPARRPWNRRARRPCWRRPESATPRGRIRWIGAHSGAPRQRRRAQFSAVTPWWRRPFPPTTSISGSESFRPRSFACGVS